MSITKITQYPSTSERGKFKSNTIDAPKLGEHEALLKLVACGVCHTDCVYMGQEGAVLGHEPICTVVEVGSQVKNIKKGDTVGTSYLRRACLECRECMSGQDALCENRVMFPEGNMNGFADYQICDSRFTYKIPEELEPKYAASLMCAGVTVFNAIYSSKILPTGRIAVIGIGGLGHLAIQFAKAWGCHVTAISTSADKKEEAMKFGAHDFLVSKEFTKESVAKLNKFDLILDTVSVNLDWDIYLGLLKKNGSLAFMSVTSDPITFKDVNSFLVDQKTFKGSIVGGRYIIDLMLEFAARHQIKPQIEEYPFDIDGIQEAIKTCDSGKARYRGVLVAKDN
ncbi:chaperonin 10-like protein [Choanephora cucurbitarum]|nr:chaperonin 10-like protein [Choanephora cucurbitarum]